MIAGHYVQSWVNRDGIQKKYSGGNSFASCFCDVLSVFSMFNFSFNNCLPQCIFTMMCIVVVWAWSLYNPPLESLPTARVLFYLCLYYSLVLLFHNDERYLVMSLKQHSVCWLLYTSKVPGVLIQGCYKGRTSFCKYSNYSAHVQLNKPNWHYFTNWLCVKAIEGSKYLLCSLQTDCVGQRSS